VTTVGIFAAFVFSSDCKNVALNCAEKVNPAGCSLYVHCRITSVMLLMAGSASS